MSAAYSTDSVHRALEHHELLGVVTTFSPPGDGQPKWRVNLNGARQPLDLTTREAYVLCEGLAAGRRAVA